MHKIYLAQKYIMPKTFVRIDCLLNCIVLKLLQTIHDLVYFLHSLFGLLIFCATKWFYGFRRLYF